MTAPDFRRPTRGNRRARRWVAALAAAALSIQCSHAFAQLDRLSIDDRAQIDATIHRFYALSHPDASCAFSKMDNNGNPVDPRVRNRAFRETAYARTFEPLFSGSLFALMRDSCVGGAEATGMVDVRLWDSEIDSDASHYGNGVRLEITQPVRILQANAFRVRVRVDWAEFLEGKSVHYGVGRTDLIMLKESGSWRIDDVYALGASDGSPKQFDMPVDDFDALPTLVHLRQPPS